VQVRINTDVNVERRSALARRVEAALGRFGGRLARVEVHLGGENADKAGAADKRCSTEARRWWARASSRQPRPVRLPLQVGVAMTTPVG
jgi:predicted component of type VI protein secretion system